MSILPTHWFEGQVMANGIHHHYYRTGGNKPPLLLLHGLLDGALTWLRTARALEEEYDVIMADARGHGLSDGITTGYSQALLTEDAAEAIRALQLDQPRIIGHSQGGGIGIRLAAKYPHLVRALIVEGWSDQTSSNTEIANSAGYKAWFNAYLSWLAQLKTQPHAERMVAALSQLPPGVPLWPEDQYVTWVENCARLNLDLVRHSISMWSEVATNGREMVEGLQQITCPTLIMKSGFFPQPGAVRSLVAEAADRPNIRIIRFENIGHLIHHDQFDPFIAVAQSFFHEH